MRHAIPTTKSNIKTVVKELSTRWIVAQRNSIAVSVSSGLIETSIDNSNTFPYSIAFSDANKINTAFIFKNGNVLFVTSDNKLWVADYNLSEINERVLYDTDGITPYVFHTPVNSSLPGRYFYPHRILSNEKQDLIVWGNYGNVTAGAVPINVYYSADFGKTIKVAYKFGQNPRTRDDGTADGGTTGNLLGDVLNPVWTRHEHCVNYCPFNNKWYLMTGDADISTVDGLSYNEIHWFEGEYNKNTDSWVWNKLDFGSNISQRTNLKITECFFYNNYIYYASDPTNLTTEDINGIYSVRIDRITDSSKHKRVYEPASNSNFISNLKFDPKTRNIMFVVGDITETSNKNNRVGIVENLDFSNVQLRDFTSYDCVRLNSVNDEGFFRIDTDKTGTLQGKTLMVKIGNDLFNNI